MAVALNYEDLQEGATPLPSNPLTTSPPFLVRTMDDLLSKIPALDREGDSKLADDDGEWRRFQQLATSPPR